MDNYPAPPTNTPQPQTENHFVAIDIDSPEPRQPHDRRKIIIIIVALVVIVSTIIGVVALLLLPKNCFETGNYIELTTLAQDFEGGDGIVLSDVVQGQELFTQSVYFIGETTDIDGDNSSDTTEFFKALGDYAKKHQDAGPINITLESSYVSGSSPDLAQKRADVIKETLIKAGVDASMISTPSPTLVTPNEDSVYDDDIIDGMPVGIRVTPVSRCES